MLQATLGKASWEGGRWLWVVGDGRAINVWRNPWLFDGATRWIVSERGEHDEDLRVGDLSGREVVLGI